MPTVYYQFRIILIFTMCSFYFPTKLDHTEIGELERKKERKRKEIDRVIWEGGGGKEGACRFVDIHKDYKKHFHHFF